MTKIFTTTSLSAFGLTIAVLFVALADNNMVYAGEYDPEQRYTNEECAEMFDPNDDRENFLMCTGGIGTPNPGPGR